jgi:hypothetical protein
VAGLAIVRLTELEVTATRQKEAMVTETAVVAVVALRIWPARRKAHSVAAKTVLRDLERNDFIILASIFVSQSASPLLLREISAERRECPLPSPFSLHQAASVRVRVTVADLLSLATRAVASLTSSA